jgi:F0F1-type ATP synthase assembly protein I
MTKEEDEKKEATETYKSYIKTSTAGLEVGLSIIVGAAAGYFADRYFDTRPYGLLAGFGVGVLAAARRLYTFARDYLKEDKKDERNKKPDA